LLWGLTWYHSLASPFYGSFGVLRDRLGDLEDRFFATVFPGSGLLFLAMLSASAAMPVESL
jgi:hypothetical protein